jgi:hypothetical protein
LGTFQLFHQPPKVVAGALGFAKAVEAFGKAEQELASRVG